MENKYGIIIYEDTTNIGDDIQSYAAACLVPRVDYVIDRENTDAFRAEKNEAVKVIMNGWYMHQKWNWPPSKCILPVFYAFNYSEESYFYYDEHMKNEFLEGEGKAYLANWGPIGCRDLDTQKLLERKGIPAFFSGCMTLTLPRREPQKPGDYICIVDIDPEAEAAVERTAKAEGMHVKKITHSIRRYKEGTPWSVRAQKVEALLDTYQKARCVVTSRLHCALPCLAMGVPVLLVREDLDDKRFQPYVQWLETATPVQIASGQCTYSFSNPPRNSEKHVPFRENMIQQIQSFMNRLVDQASAAEEDRIRQWQMETMKTLLDRSLKDAKTMQWKLQAADQRGRALQPEEYRDAVLKQFADGKLGFRYIVKYMLAWLRYKLGRKK